MISRRQANDGRAERWHDDMYFPQHAETCVNRLNILVLLQQGKVGYTQFTLSSSWVFMA